MVRRAVRIGVLQQLSEKITQLDELLVKLFKEFRTTRTEFFKGHVARADAAVFHGVLSVTVEEVRVAQKLFA